MNGFFLANPAGAWAFAAVAAVLVLYLFYRRFRPQAVTGLFLWGAPRREEAGGRKLDKPLVGRSLLLDLLAAAALALAVAAPSHRAATGLPVVLVLDNSFAMRARDNLPRARRIGTEILAEAARRGVDAAVVLAGERPEVWRGMGRWTADEAAALMERFRPDADGGDLQAAAALAVSLHGAALEMHVITNREETMLAGLSGRLVGHILDGRGGNLAVARAWREADGASRRERAVFVVANHGARAADAVLEIAAVASPGDPVHRGTLRLEPGQSLRTAAPLAFLEDSTLVVRLLTGDEDVIADDSVAYLPPSPVRAVSYLIEDLNPRAERYFDLALAAAGCLPAPWDTAGVPAPDLLVTAGGGSRGGVVTLEVPPESRPGVFSPPYVVDTANPLCRDVDLSAVPWVVAGPEAPDEWAEAYIMAGDTPLYWRSADGRLHLNLVPERSLIVNDPAWPVLMANLAALARERLPGLAKTLYAPGEALAYIPAPGAPPTALALVGADGGVRALRRRDAALPREPGLYRLRTETETLGDLAVLPSFENASDASRLAAAERTTVAEASRDGAETGVLDLTWAALLAGVALLAWNWRAGMRLGAEGRKGAEDA